MTHLQLSTINTSRRFTYTQQFTNCLPLILSAQPQWRARHGLAPNMGGASDLKLRATWGRARAQWGKGNRC